MAKRVAKTLKMRMLKDGFWVCIIKKNYNCFKLLKTTIHRILANGWTKSKRNKIGALNSFQRVRQTTQHFQSFFQHRIISEILFKIVRFTVYSFPIIWWISWTEVCRRSFTFMDIKTLLIPRVFQRS